MPRPRRWQLLPRAPAEHFQRFQHLPGFVAQILHNRGICDPQVANDFLSGPEALSFGDPLELKDVDKAVSRLLQALDRQEIIAVYGDFDVDGITAVALLTLALRQLGATVIPYIPHRVDEGYGLNTQALENLRAEGASLVVTVDCGIGSPAEVAHANRLGMDVIVTDHHHVPLELPLALAVIDPKQSDCRYPHKELAGVGLAFKVIQAMTESLGATPVAAMDPNQYLDLVALGTVADLAPLIGENRKLVKLGLLALNDTERPGLQEMILKARLQLGQLDTYAISFILGPRLNAAGRIESALTSLNLLLTDSLEQARELAESLETLNQERQRLTSSAVDKAKNEVHELADDALLLIAGEDYPAGIVGLVANKLVEEFYRPSIVVEKGALHCRGSARSIPEFDIVSALDECQDLLLGHGGHRQAAGFTVTADNLPLLRSRLLEIARRQLFGLDLQPTLYLDALLELNQVTWENYDWISRLAPYGYGNPQPILLSRRARVKDYRLVGTNGNHLKLKLTDGRLTWDAIGFRLGDKAREIALNPWVDLAYTLEINEWNGAKTLQLNLRGIRPSTS
ncbi:MAG: single-stranded-DNA-specific exonuclease RecJ [Chloroflexi bacterium]|nr:single-stranded-DNA-specific exonuclease RecJ [Chloroflexota bacterium]